MREIFEEIRVLAQRSQLRPALERVVNVVKGNRERLPGNIVNAALTWSTKLNYLDAARVAGDIDFDLYNSSVGKILSWLFNYLDYLENALANAPSPVELPRSLPDARADDDGDAEKLFEAQLLRSPLQDLAWLQAGLISARAVCKLVTRTNVGTGFLIGGGRILTNHHVVADRDAASGATAIFNYQDDIRGVPEPSVALDASDFIAADAGLDCAIIGLRAEEEQCVKWGRLQIDTGAALSRGDGVCIIQHPDGGPKKLAVSGNAITSHKEPFIQYIISTMKGSSGSPVFNWNWSVVALHHAAGTWSDRYQRWVNNEGILLSSIANHPQIGPLIKECQNSAW